jgi:regulator of protease activity HflC (stomatin/prohibitin superfamily)
MGLFKKDYQVRPNQIGFLFRDNVLEDKLTSGRHEIWDWKNRTELICLPTTDKLIAITNQEVLTKDNVALRFSFNILYKIADGEKFLSKFEVSRQIQTTIGEAEQRVYNIVQVFIRNKIASFDSEELNEKRSELSEFKNDEMEKQVLEFGISIQQAQLKDITFPKAIQDLFAKHLESKIRAKADLENARTAVATARALKNASELMKGDDNIKFFQFMETITKIAAKGKHTFMIGDFSNAPKQY